MTSKQHLNLNMSLLPLAIIVVLILGVGYFLLKGEIKLPQFNSGPQIRRLTGFPVTVNTSAVLEKKRLVITNEQELTQFLNSIDSSGTLVLKDKINFDKEFVIAASTSTNDETGHSLKIKKVYEDKKDNSLTVSIEELGLGKYCELNPVKNVVVDLVAISKTDAKISFERAKKNVDCENTGSSSETTQTTPSTSN